MAAMRMHVLMVAMRMLVGVANVCRAVVAVRVCGMNERMGVGVVDDVPRFRLLRFPGSQGA